MRGIERVRNHPCGHAVGRGDGGACGDIARCTPQQRAEHGFEDGRAERPRPCAAPRPGIHPAGHRDHAGSADENQRQRVADADVILEDHIAPSVMLEHRAEARAPDDRKFRLALEAPRRASEQPHLVSAPLEFARGKLCDGIQPADARVEELGGDEDFHFPRRSSLMMTTMSPFWSWVKRIPRSAA